MCYDDDALTTKKTTMTMASASSLTVVVAKVYTDHYVDKHGNADDDRNYLWQQSMVEARTSQQIDLVVVVEEAYTASTTLASVVVVAVVVDTADGGGEHKDDADADEKRQTKKIMKTTNCNCCYSLPSGVVVSTYLLTLLKRQ